MRGDYKERWEGEQEHESVDNVRERNQKAGGELAYFSVPALRRDSRLHPPEVHNSSCRVERREWREGINGVTAFLHRLLIFPSHRPTTGTQSRITPLHRCSSILISYFCETLLCTAYVALNDLSFSDSFYHWTCNHQHSQCSSKSPRHRLSLPTRTFFYIEIHSVSSS